MMSEIRLSGGELSQILRALNEIEADGQLISVTLSTSNVSGIGQTVEMYVEYNSALGYTHQTFDVSDYSSW